MNFLSFKQSRTILLLQMACWTNIDIIYMKGKNENLNKAFPHSKNIPMMFEIANIVVNSMKVNFYTKFPSVNHLIS